MKIGQDLGWFSGRLQAGLEASGKGEGAALALRAGNGEMAAHALHQPAADGEAQAAAAILTRDGGVGLREIAKNIVEFFSGNTDSGVRNRELDVPRRARTGVTDGKQDFPGIGEFDCIAQKIHQNLPEAIGVAQQRGREIGHQMGH